MTAIDYDALLADIAAFGWADLPSDQRRQRTAELLDLAETALIALRAALAEKSIDADRFNAVLAITFNDAHPITQIAATLPDPQTPYELIDMLDQAIAMAAQEKVK